MEDKDDESANKQNEATDYANFQLCINLQANMPRLNNVFLKLLKSVKKQVTNSAKQQVT